jgi:hypothetical protein
VVDAKNTRLLPAVPVVDSVPLMVCWESTERTATPADAGPVTARLLNLFAPTINRVPAAVDENKKFQNVNPACPTEIVALVPEQTNCDVPALKVRLVNIEHSTALPLAVQVMVELFKFITLAVLDAKFIAVQVTA